MHSVDFSFNVSKGICYPHFTKEKIQTLGKWYTGRKDNSDSPLSSWSASQNSCFISIMPYSFSDMSDYPFFHAAFLLRVEAWHNRWINSHVKMWKILGVFVLPFPIKATRVPRQEFKMYYTLRKPWKTELIKF